jgi:uncharacterized protein YndB with AHSA1/START domain
MSASPPDIEPFTISRVFDAPRTLLFSVNTAPDHLAEWMSPDGFENIHATLDFSVGGSFHYGIENAAGMQMWGKQVFLEIVPNEKLRFLQSFSNKEGGLTRHPMAEQWPLEMLATTTFKDAAPGKSEMTISWTPHHTDAAGIACFDAMRPMMEMGFTGTLNKLERYLAKIQM